MHRLYEKIRRRFLRLRPMPESVTIDLRGGHRVCLRPAVDPYERDIFIDRTYEPATLALFEAVLHSTDTMVDIGANLGLMTLHAARCAKRVISIEPHPKYAPRLAQHLHMNDVRNVTLIKEAAGEIAGQLPIYDVPSANIGRSSLIRPEIPSAIGGYVTVTPLDEILERESVSAVRLIKIDVEGYEPAVLRGASQTLRLEPIICMEVSAKVVGDSDPLHAHRILMNTGIYGAWRFKHGKAYACRLVPATDAVLAKLNDNVVYIPHAIRPTLPQSIFD